MINPATANGESQVGMVEKEKKEKERDFRYRVAKGCWHSFCRRVLYIWTF